MKKNWILNLLIVLVGILLTISLISTLLVWLQPQVKNPHEDPDDDPSVPKISIVEYEVFEGEDLPFSFILGTLNIKSEEPLTVSISDFVSTQQINLGEIDVFLNDLLAIDIDLKQPRHEIDLIFNEIITDANFKLFIPLRKNGSDTLTLFYKGEKEISVLFELNNHLGDIASLVESEAGEFIDHFVEADAYDVKVLSISEISTSEVSEILADGSHQEMVFPSTARIIGVLLNIKALGLQAVEIEAATLTLPIDNQVTQALNEKVEVYQFDNLFKKPIIDKASGFLFFDIYLPEPDIINQVKEIKIKLKGYDQWLNVKVE